MDAVTENSMAQGALTGQVQLQAFPEQDHDAHIQTHLAYMSSKIVQLNPQLISVMQNHILQHINLKAQALAQQQMPPEMQQQMQMQQPPQPNPQMDAMVSQIQAQLMTQYVQQEAQLFAGQDKDPLVDLKAQELQLRQQQMMQEAENDKQRLDLDTKRAMEQTAVARERIDSAEDIAEMRAQIAMARTMNRGG